MADSSLPLLEIPLVEVDFHPWRSLSGWQAAVYQVYLHRPTVHLRQEAGEAWNWSRWARNASQRMQGGGNGFVLGRLYADVVEVHLWGADGPISADNGVVTISGLQLPPAHGNAEAAIAAHFRADGGKLSVVGQGNAFAVQDGMWRPQLKVTITQQGIGPAVAEPMGWPATGSLSVTADR